MSTVETLIDRGIQKSGKKMEEIAQMLGVSLPTLFRQRKGKSKNSYTEKDCVVSMVDQGIVEPKVLLEYCDERCPIWAARKKYRIKAGQLPLLRRFIEKIRAAFETARETITSRL